MTTPSMKAHKIIIKIQHCIMTNSKKTLRITILKNPNQHNNNQHEGTQNYKKYDTAL
jgi:hypothetical protein